MLQTLGLSEVKTEVQQEKQLLVEIYKMAFEHFLNNVFTTEFLKLRIKEELEYDVNVLTFTFAKDGYGATITDFQFDNMIADLFFYKLLKKTIGFALVKSKFKNYKRLIKDNFIYDTSKLTLREIKDLVIDESETWQLLIKKIENENIKYVFLNNDDCLVFKMDF
ncbi:hypothetical protein [Bacillus cereus]|uniref:hypothetical protein n=1 Tax=Bacillus cereus TaxID=1396 RepID=UPI00032F1762|nr:hypothetical protein [Bacillus cereus]EOO22123.1 hypothetical protein ICC_06528 [Bacillus cereus BAG1X1-1]EOO42445.1 hypothetical protein ICI_06493 [Bacillus cereus BAG1X2-1]EOO43798.1 hypothetical protein ICK_06699 [Bacillus cereus BAG1X2-2]EOP00505.1 hypothetical protein ICO_06207 [Bacillus cereus BAG2O-1]